MTSHPTSDPISVIKRHAQPLHGSSEDFDTLFKHIGNVRFVLIGEATHGTHDFYRIRAEISKRLIQENSFHAVAVEADWPDAYRTNRYVRHLGGDADAVEALGAFKRFPTWMWRNADVLDFIGWLRSYNDHFKNEDWKKIGFYGLDLYSLYASAEAVIHYLEKVDPEAAARARLHYGCFEQFHHDPSAYAYALQWDLSKSCQDDAVRQLMDLRRHAIDYLRRDGIVAEDDLFCAEQNARLVKNAEAYYRTMFEGHVESWNLRDRHMADTFEALVAHLDKRHGRSKIIVWAHNSHIGDARATAMGDQGEFNIGQLIREYAPNDTFLIGFTTDHGTVTAASHWGAAPERKHVRPALAGSYEALFHTTGLPKFLLNLRDPDVSQALTHRHLERAIGVLYLPQTERQSHYFPAQLPAQFDVVIHLDDTRAVEPLERTAQWEQGEFPETFPSGI